MEVDVLLITETDSTDKSVLASDDIILEFSVVALDLKAETSCSFHGWGKVLVARSSVESDTPGMQETNTSPALSLSSRFCHK